MQSTDQNGTKTTGKKPDIPEGVQIGDFLVGKFTKSEWSRFFPWENWDHASLVSNIDPLMVIEASGIILQREDKKKGKKEIREGVVEYEFLKPRMVDMIDGTKKPGNVWLQDTLEEVLWLRPLFPQPLREIDQQSVPWRKRKIITPQEARRRVVAYARRQLGEPFKLSVWRNTKFTASKRDENEWYCSLVVFKAYSRTVTNMYLESYEPTAGFFVMPEDLVQSKRSIVYHHWINENFFPQQ